MKSPRATRLSPSSHYENFPVASWLCPPALRAPISAVYWFARVADDIADEGDASAEERLEQLRSYREQLAAAGQGTVREGPWRHVFEPLAEAIATWHPPLQALDDLLDAFAQDVGYTASGRRYRTDAELLDYCQRSANPIGRLLLHLYNVGDDVSLAQSDHICTALQLINFWQDLGVDVSRGRWYPSEQRMQRHGVTQADLLRSDAKNPRARALVADYCAAARDMMLAGSPLVHRIPGRAGWELRLVVQGGLRILDKIAAMDHATWRQRPKLAAPDFPLLVWRACRMPIPQATPRSA